MIKRNDMVLFNVIGENEYGLLNPLTRKLHRINETGRFIWDFCKESRSLDEIASTVAEHFHISTEEARKDVKGFAEQMTRYGLLEEL